MGIKKYSQEIKDATHSLSCRHAIGVNGYDYSMRCIVLKRMAHNRLKILVFGDRYWKFHDDKKQIRYVDKYRVKPKEGVL